jgi:outer membrane translocation and assembly module TamA
LINACNPSKKLKEGEYLLNKNSVHIEDSKTLDKSEIANYIRLKPNYKLLGLFRFNLFLYNIVNENRLKRKQVLRDEKFAKKNERRDAKGKRKKTKPRLLLGEWMLNVGEPPVVYDSMLVRKSEQQIKLYLNNKGYFLSTVKDSIIHKRHKKINVDFFIKANTPYRINSVSYEIADTLVRKYVKADSANCLLKKGNNYDLDVIQEERDRLEYYLNNRGYYLFTKEFIYFKIDTISVKQKVNIIIGIKNYVKKADNLTDSIIEMPHKQYYINNIYIDTEYSALKNDSIKRDSLIAGKNGEYKILYNGKLKYKPKVLLDAIFINKGDLYIFRSVEATYKRLSEIKVFKFINVFFKETSDGKLDCYIQLSPSLKQSMTLESEGTNTSGNLGVSGSIVYQNKNWLKGSELLELKIKGGFSAQRLLNQTKTNIVSNGTAFNTIEFGPELNVYLPRFWLPIRTVSLTKLITPKTVFTSGLNYQRRTDYTRLITNFSLGYTWKQSTKIQHAFYPVVINFVKVDLTSSFDSLLKDQNQYIRNTFSNHLSTSTRYSFTYTGQNLKVQKSFSFFKINLEASGNALRGLYSLTNRVEPNTFVKDDKNRFTFLNIAYSQYVRADAEYRYYLDLHELGKIVFRIAGGIGKALANYNVLPFERSFFSGGTNGLRAWQSRTIGPGSYANRGFSYDKFGDGQLEANVEHRFKIFKMLNGAIFVDAGNVWLRNPDSSRVGGDFQLNRFYKEIAIGTGIGLRADFSFFIIRTDFGIKARDPQFSENNRWVLPYLFNSQWKQDYKTEYGSKYNFVVFNLGIGYPF